MQAPQFFDQPAMPSQMSFGYQQHQQHQQQHYQDPIVMVAHPLPPLPPGYQWSYQQLLSNATARTDAIWISAGSGL
ncbi:Protein CBG17807 [Caenorhabditis briggsae]|uniref:Protein CBG17807 n=1 Tax=Caenorhabditis briggsae TaxID=6238 RepID=A8XRU4_CAEBR|nr:Protein CBG17807 [Caenorhabditis briggsae]CAP35369.2 Protein CBG17807 [Caenorhabditis briggsae]